MTEGRTEVLQENRSYVTFSTKNSTWTDLLSNLAFCSGRLMTNYLSHGAALYLFITEIVVI